MIHDRLIRAALATALVVTLPAAAAAQEDEPATPEGLDWALTSYYDEGLGELVSVPFEVEPTLRLEDGIASGFGGCNQFSGSYELEEGQLRFSEELSVTLAFCEDPAGSLEDAYLAALGEVEGWFIDEGVLELSDDFGTIVLTFEVSGAALTSSQLAALLATMATLETEAADLRTEIETLRSDTDALNVPRLRERIKVLEADNKKLKRRVEELEGSPTVDPAPRQNQQSTFTAAEKVLLQGIPTRIGNTCRPLRSSLPKGTRAVVSCAPNTIAVASVDYDRMNGEQAAAAFGAEMSDFNVPDVTAADRTCAQGVKSQRRSFGNGWQAEGCYRIDGRAELRFVDNATDCKKLRVGGKNVASPAMLIALQGTTNDVQRVHQWATKNRPTGSSQLTSITQPIPSNLGASPACPN